MPLMWSTALFLDLQGIQAYAEYKYCKFKLNKSQNASHLASLFPGQLMSHNEDINPWLCKVFGLLLQNKYLGTVTSNRGLLQVLKDQYKKYRDKYILKKKKKN